MVTSKQLTARTGITYRQADYWCRVRWLHAEGEGAGSGSYRSFHEREIPVARALATMSALDLTGTSGGARRSDWIRDLTEFVRENGLIGTYRFGDGIVTIDLARIGEMVAA